MHSDYDSFEFRAPTIGLTAIRAAHFVRALSVVNIHLMSWQPVFLAGDSFEAWLDGSAGVELLCSAPENLLHVWPVSKRVNRSGTGGDDPTLIDRIAS